MLVTQNGEILFEDYPRRGAVDKAWELASGLEEVGATGRPPRYASAIEAPAVHAAGEHDVVMAAGAGDQRLYLFRERGFVVVRQADQILRGMIARRAAVKWSDAEFIRLLK
jgi:hypothetical protein